MLIKDILFFFLFIQKSFFLVNFELLKIDRLIIRFSIINLIIPLIRNKLERDFFGFNNNKYNKL